MKKNKEESPTVKSYKRWRNAHRALKAVEFSAPIAPFGVTLGVNWNEWFPQDGNHVSVGVGLVLAFGSLIVSILALMKKDSEFMKSVGIFIPIAFGFIAWGSVCVLLSSVLMELGKAMIFTGCGVIASALSDSVDRAVVKEKYEYMKKLADENGLSKKGEWQKAARKQAKQDAVNKYGAEAFE